jgi:hypothetical protein
MSTAPKLREEAQSLVDEIGRDIDLWHASSIDFQIKLDTSTRTPARNITSEWSEAVAGSFRILVEPEEDPILDIRSRARLFVKSVLAPSFKKWRAKGYEVKLMNPTEKTNPMFPHLRARADYEKTLQLAVSALIDSDTISGNHSKTRVSFLVEKK